MASGPGERDGWTMSTQSLLAGMDTQTIILIVVGIVVYVVRGGTGGELVDQILDMLRKILNRPEVSTCNHSECSHDLDKVEGLVLAVKAIQDKLTEVGEADLVQRIDAALPKLVTSQRAKMA